MKLHGLVVRDGEDAGARGSTGSLPCSLTAPALGMWLFSLCFL